MIRTTEIEEKMKILSEQIKELELQKINAEAIELKKTGECCPDVCKTIAKTIAILNNDLRRAEFNKDKLIKMIGKASKIFKVETPEKTALEKQAIRKAKRIEVLIKEQILSLNNLKQTLSEKNICKCK